MVAFHASGYCRSTTGMVHKYDGSIIIDHGEYFQAICGPRIKKRSYNVGPFQTAKACKRCQVNLDIVFSPKAWKYDLSGIPLYDE